jgi:hypothetical protein
MKRFLLELWKDLTILRKPFPLPKICPSNIPIDQDLRDRLLNLSQKTF